MTNTPMRFEGKSGSVPTVDPEDVKAVLQLYRDTEKDCGHRDFAIGMNLVKHVCKPGADVEAVLYPYDGVVFLP